ncbi:30S ribosomal protein S3 [bacterium]|nr:30S ribosomal protein S3 [bacterium]
MGQKTNPTSFRLQTNKNWQSKWFAERSFATQLKEDLAIRRVIADKLTSRAGVSSVDIDRSANNLTITIHSSKPGVVIGRAGSGTDMLKKALSKVTGPNLKLNIEEVKSVETNAQLVANNIASQLERRMPFRRAIKMTAEAGMKAGAKGIKIAVSGRLNGAEMARREVVAQGSIPLHTLRANIDYATAEAMTTFGVIGVKVWVYKD